MPKLPESSNRIRQVLTRGWRALSSAYDTANRVTYHALSWLLILLTIAYFAFAAAFLSLRYLVLPNIDSYKPQVEQLAGELIHRPVRIDGIAASWRGLNPQLQLHQLVIHDDSGEAALVLPKVEVTVSWWSVLGELRLQTLEIERPDLEIERDPDGRLSVAGLRLDAEQPDDGRVLDWLLAQREIVIRDGSLRWKDQLRRAPELTLQHIDFVLQNQWRTHRAALKATPPPALAAPIDMRVEFTRPPFSQRSSDYAQWVGELYLDWRNTRLDAWKPYLDFPVELSGGNGSVRAWMNFNRGVVDNVTADLALTQLNLQLGKDLEPMKLLEVSGRVSAGEAASGLKEKIFSFGAEGHALRLTNFSLRTESGSVLPKTTVSHVYAAARSGKPEQHELKVTELDLGALAQLAAHLPLSREEREWLRDFSPRGALRDFVASWEGGLPGQGRYKITGKFNDLSVRQQPARGAQRSTERVALPGFEGLSGKIDATQEGGQLTVSGQRVTLHLGDYLPEPKIAFDELTLDGSWSLRERHQLTFRIGQMQFTQGGLAGRLEGSHVLPLPFSANHPGELDVRAHFPSVELRSLPRLLPSAVSQDVRDWMSGALLQGRAQDIDLTLRGDLRRFPFHQKSPSDRPQGTFKITARLDNAELSPTPKELGPDRRSPLWPKIENIQGHLTLERSRLVVRADSARTLGAALSAVEVVIPDFMASSPMLDVSGNASATLQTMLAYVNSTPVSGWIDGLTEEARATGNARLALKLQLPLGDSGQSAAQGTLRFAGNEVQLWKAWPAVQQVTGELAFSEQGFQLNGIQGSFLGGPLAITGGSQRDGTMQVRFDGGLSAEGIARALPGATAKRVMKKIAGSTRYTATLRLRNQRPEFTLESSLAGVSVDLPPPLQKSAGESWPLRLSLMPVPGTDPMLQSEEIRLNLGRAISSRYLRQRSSGKQATWRLVRGGIGVNQPIPQPDAGLSMAISLPTMNADAWRNAIADLTAESGTSDGSGAVAQEFAAFFKPDAVNLRATQLQLAERMLDNVVIGAIQQRGGWQFNIHSDEVIGNATWDDPSSERGAGKLTARLSSLKIERTSDTEVAELLSKRSTTELPGLDIIADSFELRQMKLGRLEVVATNAGSGTNAAGREWRISRLTLVNTDATLRATGKWLVAGGDSQSSLNYELDINDAGKLLDRVGFEKVLRGGKGKMEGDLNWKGSPSAFDFPTLSGNLNLRINSGQFLKADPGVAKLLNVMSLQSLPRRLTLDFRDVFSEGFAFDSIASTASISRGQLRTDTFKMRGVNAVVLMDGTVDLNEETQNMYVVVIPELNAGGASVVYGLAVNPVVGLGSFLAQLFLRNPLSQALTQEYQVTGPWKDPVIKKSTTKRKLPSPPADADKPAN